MTKNLISIQEDSAAGSALFGANVLVMDVPCELICCSYELRRHVFAVVFVMPKLAGLLDIVSAQRENALHHGYRIPDAKPLLRLCKLCFKNTAKALANTLHVPVSVVYRADALYFAYNVSASLSGTAMQAGQWQLALAIAMREYKCGIFKNSPDCDICYTVSDVSMPLSEMPGILHNYIRAMKHWIALCLPDDAKMLRDGMSGKTPHDHHIFRIMTWLSEFHARLASAYSVSFYHGTDSCEKSPYDVPSHGACYDKAVSLAEERTGYCISSEPVLGHICAVAALPHFCLDALRFLQAEFYSPDDPYSFGALAADILNLRNRCIEATAAEVSASKSFARIELLHRADELYAVCDSVTFASHIRLDIAHWALSLALAAYEDHHENIKQLLSVYGTDDLHVAFSFDKSDFMDIINALRDGAVSLQSWTENYFLFGSDLFCELEERLRELANQIEDELELSGYEYHHSWLLSGLGRHAQRG